MRKKFEAVGRSRPRGVRSIDLVLGLRDDDNPMMINKNLFPAANDLPEWVKVPKVNGRILIDGQIMTTGFSSRPVSSPCSLRNEADQSLYFPELGTTPQVTSETLMLAVDAASNAWSKGRGAWPSARMEERISAIASLRDRILKHREVICRLLMWEIAKTWTDAQAEFDRTITYMNDTIEATKQLDRDCSRIQFVDQIMAQIRRSPLGVTLCMGPFNYPFNETFTTLIPALIVGNPVIVKLPRFGQLLWDFLLEPFRDCLPPGVINVVNGAGREIINPAVRSGKIDVLAFIGSSQVANQIKQSHPNPHRFRSILGLDAKNPAIILPDADLDLTASECVRGSLSFNGQRCTALKMILVHRSVSKAFIQKFSDRVDQLNYGLPWDPGVMITPLADRNKPAQLEAYLKEVLDRGGTLCNPTHGGKTVGSLFFPAVVSGVPLESRLAQEEQFGPIVPIVEFDSVEEVEDYVLHSQYGMQASVFGKEPKMVGGLVDFLSNQVCRINLNSQCQRGPDVFPFTGRKNSAEGTLSVTDALRSFSIRSMVAAKQDAMGKQVIQGILDGDTSHFLTTNIVL
jgi:glyceraldehyde-3-phosphate dehydrogenase (NADP+)